MPRTRALIAALFAPSLAAAATLGEESRFVINPVNATDFEVIEMPHMAAAEFWCAAASFHEVRQGRSENTRLYVRRAEGPALTQTGARGVVFTTDPGRAPARPAGLSLTVSQPGASLKSAQARRYCRDAFTRSTK